MGVDLTATVEVREDEHLHWVEVAEVFCGRWYHWAPYLEDAVGPRIVMFRTLRQHRHEDIFDGKVKEADLYIIMAALAKVYGRRNVRMTWRAS